jgi:hypothetical protein
MQNRVQWGKPNDLQVRRGEIEIRSPAAPAGHLRLFRRRLSAVRLVVLSRGRQATSGHAQTMSGLTCACATFVG